jgi:hypothetical protein
MCGAGTALVVTVTGASLGYEHLGDRDSVSHSQELVYMVPGVE